MRWAVGNRTSASDARRHDRLLLVRPATGAAAGVLIWRYLRSRLRSARWASGWRVGIFVTVVNPFYRTKKAPTAPNGSATPIADLRPLTSVLNENTHMTDAKAFIAWLDQQPSVAKNRKIGTQGYCMGGPIAFRTAAAVPDRVGAVASFHGGGLVTDKDTSPHLVLPKVKARLYFGHAENDQSMPAEAIAKLDAALTAWGGRYESEVYKDAKHGWMIEGRDVHHPQQAEHGFTKLQRLLELTFGKRTSG